MLHSALCTAVEPERMKRERDFKLSGREDSLKTKKKMALKEQYFLKFLETIMCILHYWFILEQSSTPVINSLFVSHDYLTLLQHCLTCIIQSFFSFVLEVVFKSSRKEIKWALLLINYGDNSYRG